MPNGGTVAIAAAALVSKDRETLVKVRVEDGGIGMSDETLKRAFDPFFTTKSDGLGGVGLPMVKRFVEDVSGRIKVYSTLGSGTCVMLVLPGDR
jgi:signal transduction histidine kinase